MVSKMTMLRSDHSPFVIRHSPGVPPDLAADPPCVIRTLDVRDAAAIEHLLGALDFAARCARYGWIGSDAALVCPVDGCITMVEQRVGPEYLNWKEFQKRGLPLNDH